ncbi:porin [Anianabacter salinae]|uniref:porin n=1 Tax=Anianabacter salinae TaxID=2851023 RepID=UPI00225E0EAF|nr:porin [Anianabacter salinae]MBV0913587.1 porin [Anianabacter salinae]
MRERCNRRPSSVHRQARGSDCISANPCNFHRDFARVLFATTALVGSAGVAAADVAVTGLAEMGIMGGTTIGNDLEFFTDIDVTFTMSGTTDGGLTFGASIDLDESDGANSPFMLSEAVVGIDLNNDGDQIDTFPVPTSGESNAFNPRRQGGESIFISGAFGTLTMGDTDGALDFVMREVNTGLGGSLNDDETSHPGFNGNSVMDGFNNGDGQIARYDYTFNSVTFAASAEIVDTPAGSEGPTYGIGVSYAAAMAGADLTFGLGYQAYSQNGVTSSTVGVSASAELSSGLVLNANYSSFTNVFSGFGNQGVRTQYNNHIGVGIGYTMGAITVGANYGVYDATVAGEANREGFGLTANYDLGGGAILQAGYGNGTYADRSTAAVGDTLRQETYTFGLAMTF